MNMMKHRTIMKKQLNQPKPSYSFSFANFRITEIKFSINENFNSKDSIKINAEIGMEPKYNAQTKMLYLKMGVRQNDEAGPFTFEIVGEGAFIFDKKPDVKSLRKISTINCPAIMFPYLRETVTDITRRSGFAPLYLAPVNFVALAEKKANKRELSK
jgi:preprotein translocase subunit SecB